MDGFVLVVVDGSEVLARVPDQASARISDLEWDYMADMEAEARKGYRAPVVIDTTGEVVS